MNIGDKVRWRLPGTTAPAWSGWGVVTDMNQWTAGSEAPRVLVEVHSFPDWLGPLEGQFHPVIRCAVTWLEVF